jgi:hypothetical protein
MNALRTIFLFSAVVLGAVALSAAPKPDFTGTWKLNLEKSDLGGIPISALVVSIQHKDPEFKYNVKGTVNGEDVEESETFTTDGKSSQDSHGNTVTSHWDGAVLVSDVVAPDGSPAYTSRMALSADGKSCTRDAVPANDQDPKRHEVYDKQ